MVDSHGDLKIGVYVCHCGKNIADVVNVKEVADFSSKLPGVEVAREYLHMCDDVGQEMISNDIRELGLNRVVVAACSPKVHELTFRETLRKAGLNPYLLEIANIREQCSWVHRSDPDGATEKAKGLVKMAVAKARWLMPLETKTVEVIRSALVIGGGIAGIQAALDLADNGYQVYLVEKSPSLGGRMGQWSKVFPTMDCAACILTPKMVSVSQHPKIELLTNSELIEASGSLGNFAVKVRRRPRYVDEDRCTACGICAQKCPVRVPNEIDFGMSSRKAIYMTSPNAVPLAYSIDGENCLYLKRGICRVCERVCEAKAIDFDQKEEVLELRVGSIIVAIGYDPFDPTPLEEYGFGRYKDVITGPMLERMTDPMGPTGGMVLRPSTGKPPRKVAFIQCVGSRDARFNLYCSRVCCMYAIKDSLIIKEQSQGSDVSIFYMDVRAFGKGYEEFYLRSQEAGVKFIRGKVSSIREDPKTHELILRYEDTLMGTALEDSFDMVVLSVGQVPRADTEAISKILGIPRSVDGFLMEAHPKLRPNDAIVDGIYLAGSAQYPKDIPDAVAQASGAAARASIPLSKGQVEVEPLSPLIDEDRCGGCGICIKLCPYGALELEVRGDKEVAKVDEVLCKGCGTCVAACPSGAARPRMFTGEQILSMIRSGAG
jgi:heterodisulfide reductase subunit A